MIYEFVKYTPCIYPHFNNAPNILVNNYRIKMTRELVVINTQFKSMEQLTIHGYNMEQLTTAFLPSHKTQSKRHCLKRIPGHLAKSLTSSPETVCAPTLAEHTANL